MTITEKTAYLKGLLEGLELGNDTPEAKLLKEVISIRVSAYHNMD